MPQTILALLALVLASLLTFGQQRLQVRAQVNMVAGEIELAGAGVASEVMALIESKSFDEQSTPEKIYAAQAIPGTPTQFTTGDSFGRTAGCDLQTPANTPGCDDVDDVHGGGWQPYTIELAREVVRDPITGDPISADSVYVRELTFEVRAEVYYVADPQSMDPAPGRTLHKRVVLDVRSPHIDGDDDGLVRLTRVVSYDPVKAEMDYENTEGYGPIGNEEKNTEETEETAP
ncbi:MAG: hypothetical protein HKN46_03065 [Acidimicrobiia bacterium]|nr:hypothetical protein [Acidimicrobiia bacterium]